MVGTDINVKAFAAPEVFLQKEILAILGETLAPP
jgi:hypothetical protein